MVVEGWWEGLDDVAVGSGDMAVGSGDVAVGNVAGEVVRRPRGDSMAAQLVGGNCGCARTWGARCECAYAEAALGNGQLGYCDEACAYAGLERVGAGRAVSKRK